MEDRYEIRFAGSGGQGIIMAALIFAEAAGVYDGKYVCQTQSYGPEARGGNSKAEVVVSKEVIDYPKATKLDLLLAMNQAACDTYFPDLKPNGLLVVDSTLVDQVPTSRVVPIPFTQIAIREAGRELVANMVALGAAGYLTQVVSLKSLESALVARVPKGTAEMNLKVFNAGIKAARKVDLNALPHSIIPEEEEA
ncbi:MAG: 2-oxoacid:acceptor oxidoreductase family protein [Deltaproteobacteria bacterium]|nr:2-oxoacid:acceptor oxidoreductase family protein [Deltaproteobacteria bacterium]MBW2565853.1 2-oxoacid:acceptor oxidoreductase family protein [Deltaproteobacteria bacterium]